MILKKLDQWSQSRYLPWVLFVAALATRLIGATIGGTRSEDDDNWHLQIAQHVLAGQGMWLNTEYGPTYSYMQPGFAFIHVVFMTLFKNFYFAERVFLHLFSSAAIVAYFYLARRLFPGAVALLSTIVLIFYPPQWFWMTRLNPHSFATNLLIINFLLFCIAFDRKRIPLMFVIGLLWGAMALFRPEYQLGVFAMMLAVLFFDVPIGKRLVLALSMFVGFAVFVAPWVIRNYRIHDRFVVSSTHYGINVWYVFNPDYHYEAKNPAMSPELDAKLKAEPNEVKRADLYLAEGKRFIRENPPEAVKRVVFNFLTYWRPYLSPKVTSWYENTVYVVSWVPIFVFFLWGLFKIPWKDPRWIAIVAFMVYKMCAHVPFYMIVRFREATMPIFLLIATLPVAYLVSRRS